MGAAPLQTPVRSGLPSSAFGAGADRFGLPSGRRGSPGVGLVHWAAAPADRSDATAATTTRLATRCDPIGTSGDHRSVNSERVRIILAAVQDGAVDRQSN